jgi:hypothetical protein
MAIDGGVRKQLKPGTTLIGRYKGTEHRAQVVEGDKGKTQYRLADGREFGSPSAAGTAVMGGIACNGWRFWSVAPADKASSRRTTMPKTATVRSTAKKAPTRKTATRTRSKAGR